MFELRLGECRRLTSARIVGSADAFARFSRGIAVQLAVRVLVVHDRDGVIARRDAIEMTMRAPVRNRALAHALRLGPVPGQAFVRGVQETEHLTAIAVEPK